MKAPIEGFPERHSKQKKKMPNTESATPSKYAIQPKLFNSQGQTQNPKSQSKDQYQFDHFSMTPSQLARHHEDQLNKQGAATTILPAIRRTGGNGPKIKDQEVKKTLIDIFSSAVNTGMSNLPQSNQESPSKNSTMNNILNSSLYQQNNSMIQSTKNKLAQQKLLQNIEDKKR